LAKRKKLLLSGREAAAQRDFQKTIFFWNGIFGLLQILFIGLIIVGVCYFGLYRTARELAGKDTTFAGSLSGVVRVMVNRHTPEAVWALVTLLTGGAFVRHRVREGRKMTQRTQDLQRKGGRRAA
jgi:hypothetical protein